jgi:outer membrane protein assembly factor BamB
MALSVRRFGTFVALASACIVSGCASWPSLPSIPPPSTFTSWWPPFGWFGGDKKLPPLPEIRDSVIATQWSASAGSAKLFSFSPSVSDKVIFTAANDGTINAIDEQGGKSVSKIDAKLKLTAGIGAAENIVVVADVGGNVLAFDASGRALWKTPLEGEILSSPIVAQSTVVARTADGRMFALNRADGKRKWVFTRSAPPLTLRTAAGVTISRGIIYAGFPAGKLVAIELESGRPVWEATLSLPRGTTELERVADVAGVPVFDDSRVCAAVYQGRTGCVETLNGNALWTRDISSADGVAVDAKNLYVADTDGNLNALDKTSGTTVWKQDKLARRDLGTPIIVKGRILVGDRTGMVHAIAPETGDLVGRVSTDGSRVQALQVNGDRALAQTERGGVFAISVR